MLVDIQHFDNPFFAISPPHLSFSRNNALRVKRKGGFRLEAMLTGEMQLKTGDNKIKLKAGQYYRTELSEFTALFHKGTSCSIFVTHYSAELLEQTGFHLRPSDPRRMPDSMTRKIDEILNNDYDQSLRDFYYSNVVRELLFFHFVFGEKSLPGEITNKDIQAIYDADVLIAEDTRKHLTIQQLARAAGTKSFKLKIGFKKFFGMGPFKRLISRRMERAKSFLETTDKSFRRSPDCRVTIARPHSSMHFLKNFS